MSVLEKHKTLIRELQSYIPKMTRKEIEFIQSISDRGFLTIGQVGFLEDIGDRYIRGKDTWNNRDEYTVGDRIRGVRTSQGWKVFLDNQEIGMSLTQKECLVAATWLNSALVELIGNRNEAQPQADQKTKEPSEIAETEIQDIPPF
jgi:hypothetical protein